MRKKLRIAVPIDFDWPVKRYHDIFPGIQSYADKLDHWELVPDTFPAPYIKPASATSKSKDDHTNQGYDGVVGEITPAIFKAAKRAGIPVVNVGHYSQVREQVPSVLTARFEAGEMAAAHLIERGLKRFACIGYRNDSVTKLFMDGVKKVAKQHDIPCKQRLISANFNQTDQSWKTFVEGINTWIDGWFDKKLNREFEEDKSKEKNPIGVISAFDGIGRCLTLLCQRRNLKIPQQVAVISAGNEQMLCEATTPSLSSIEFGQHRVGYRAAQLLDEILRGKSPPAEPIWISPSQLIARRSSDAFHVTDEAVTKALRYMAENCGENLDVDTIAKHAMASRRTLERRFRDTLGSSINDELIKLRIELIKRLLIETQTPVKSLAALVGYNTPEHMRYLFKKMVGISAKAYREQNSPR